MQSIIPGIAISIRITPLAPDVVAPWIFTSMMTLAILIMVKDIGSAAAAAS